ncbi:MAG: ATP-binding protein [Acidobacteriota bacterium]
MKRLAAIPHDTPGGGGAISARRLVWAAVLLGLWAPASLADLWYVHYAQAERALDRGEWSRAIEELQQALERRGDSAARVKTYGMNIIPYFPHLKLGIAYLELGEPAAALQAFETEELLEEIQKSEKHQTELNLYRQRAEQALAEAAEAEAARIRGILEASLREATALARSGSPAEALAALDRGLAVAPEDPDAVALAEELRRTIAAEQEAALREQRAAAAIEQGRLDLAAGRLDEAASAFQRALAIRPSSEARTLLDTVQQQLRAELERSRREQDAAQRAAAIRAELDEASRLQAAGEDAAALAKLQTVLALEPDNAEARTLQDRILEARSRAEQETARQSEIEALLARADEAWNADRVDASLDAANRVLAVEPGNATALGYVLRAHRRISRDLLGDDSQNLPPAIRFVDLRSDGDDGSRLQRVTEPDFRLSGMIVDESAVQVTLSDQTGRELAASQSSQQVGEIYLTEFNLTTRLAAGGTTLRLTATDSDGLSSASEYAVHYQRPFFRAPWFTGGLLALAGLAGSGALWRRHRRRQRLLTRRFNPYIAGAPILDEDLFFGRQGLIDRILQTVHNNSLLLHGERRIGKTTLQHHLKRRLQQLDDPDYAFFPVYIDLQGTPQEKFFATLAEDTFQELEPQLEGLESSLSEEREYTYRDLVRDLRKVLAALAQQTPKKVKLVLLIDEVDELNEYDPRVNQRLRSLFMKSFAEHLVAVVSGVAIKKQWEREGSPWYNFFEEIEVKAFGREDAERLIVDPIRGLFQLEDGLVERIISLTGGKPYLIQKMCIALVHRLHETGRRMITLADVEAVGRPEEA